MVIAADRWPLSIEIYIPRRIYRDIAGVFAIYPFDIAVKYSNILMRSKYFKIDQLC